MVYLLDSITVWEILGKIFGLVLIISFFYGLYKLFFDVEPAPTTLTAILALEINETEALVKLRLGIPFTEICNASTAEEAQECYNNADEDSELELSALLRWIELESDLEKMPQVYCEADEQNDFVERIAAKKWDELAMHHVNGTDAAEEELLRLYKLTPQGSESELIVIKNLYEIYKKK